MPANTPRGYPYPLGTDRVMDGDDSIRALAEAVDTKLGVIASGAVTVTVTNSVSGFAAVVFPAGMFTVPPKVIPGNNGGSGSSAYLMTVSGITAAGCNINAIHRDGTSSSATVAAVWIAVP